MNRIIGVTELQRKFRSVFDEVAHKHTSYILTRGSRPEAVLVPYDQYLKFAQADETGVLKRFDVYYWHTWPPQSTVQRGGSRHRSQRRDPHR